MVFKLQLWDRTRVQSLVAIAAFLVSSVSGADAETASNRLHEAQSLFQSGQYFKSARYAFAAAELDPSIRPMAYAWITAGLTRTGLYNAASYFFIRTLQQGDKLAIRHVLNQTQDLLIHVGPDLLRKYLIRHTTYEDYDLTNRSAYLYSLGKDALLGGRTERAIGYLNGMSPHSALWPYALQLRGAANAILGKNEAAIQDFQDCVDKSKDDLEARCLAGKARTLYQMDQFQEADRIYDQIRKASFVWTDILFEQAWNAFGKQEYNRTLGKLVTYKNPLLDFVFNSEVEVLRAQTYLALCLYADANETINDFNKKYVKIGEEVKRFVEGNSTNLNAFYSKGKEALIAPLHTKSLFYKMMNRFVRGPYFQGLVASEKATQRELQGIQQFDATMPGVSHEPGEGFPGFLELVLSWRMKSIRLLGGVFIKNSLMDYHSILISDFEKMAFIKLEMLGRAKDKLMKVPVHLSDRSRGNVIPSKRYDQYYWSFNGEFWSDELGDYIFGLESECNSS